MSLNMRGYFSLRRKMWYSLLLSFVALSMGQLEMGLPVLNGSSGPNLNLVNLLSSNSTFRKLSVCDSSDDISNTYCKCSDKVVTCDFSHFINPVESTNISNNDHNVHLTLYGYQYPKDTARFCVCNTPEFLHLVFERNHFLPRQNLIQRFDLYNLSGLANFTGGFSMNFNGDLYISNVSQIPLIDSFEFSRGNDDLVKNVQNLTCCSNIKVSQTYSKPVLFIEKTNIGSITARGINDDHLWKTLILKEIRVDHMRKFGIIFNGYTGVNFALLSSTIQKAESYSIILQQASNVFLANNNFKRSSGDRVFGARSILNDSNVIFFNNFFSNGLILNIEAKQFVCWYNVFNIWDSHTFIDLNHTEFSSKEYGPRFVSLKHNFIDVAKISENSLEFSISSFTNLSLKENILGQCNCSRFMMEDAAVDREKNWCFSGRERAYGKNGCSIRLHKAMEKCTRKSSDFNFPGMCNDKSVSVPGFPMNLNDKDEHVQSSFISNIVQEFRSIFNQTVISKLEDLLGKTDSSSPITGNDYEKNEIGGSEGAASGTDADGGNPPPESNIINDISPAHSTSTVVRKKSTATIPVLVTLFVVVFLIVASLYLLKNRYRLFPRHRHQSLVESEGNVLI